MVVAKPARVGARGVDSLPFSQAGTAEQAVALKASGLDFVALYLGVAGLSQAAACLDAGLAIFGVTLAGAYDGAQAVARAQALGLPRGCTLFLDVEGAAAFATPPVELAGKINAWARLVSSAGFVPGIYLGSPQPLTSGELTALGVVRYWRGIGRCVDRTGALAEPRAGWCMTQMHPSVTWAGVWVDVNIVGQDYQGRVPSMAAR